jgi:DNA-binding NtrC family response regulator
MTTIYKICTAAEWREAEREGRYRGSAVDARDGFIHFSTAEQAAETAAKHFAGQHDLMLNVIDAEALVGRTVADVERDLILETLKHCLGNRTHAANILGISIRTLRNKLNEYAGDGVPVPPPGGGEVRGAA